MNTTIEEEDIRAIAREVVNMFKPLLKQNGKVEGGEITFDVEGLAKYLKVEESRIYKRVMR